jgi:hypothetical protein
LPPLRRSSRPRLRACAPGCVPCARWRAQAATRAAGGGAAAGAHLLMDAELASVPGVAQLLNSDAASCSEPGKAPPVNML